MPITESSESVSMVHPADELLIPGTRAGDVTGGRSRTGNIMVWAQLAHLM